MNVISQFVQKVNNNPGKLAIITKSDQITFGDLHKEVMQTALHFRRKGIRKGDRILVFVPMGLQLYIVVLALFYLGAVAVFVDQWVKLDRLKKCCDMADCKAIVMNKKLLFFAFFLPFLRRIPIKLSLSNTQEESTFEYEEMQPSDCAILTFTTGSIGRPKAVSRSHRFLLNQFEALVKEIQPKEKDVDICSLPIVVLLNLGIGASTIIPDFKQSRVHKIRPQKIIDQINEHNATKLTCSPFFAQAIAGFLLKYKSITHDITKIVIGGAPVFPDQAKLLRQAFDKTDIQIVYGATEAEPISSIGVADLIELSEHFIGLPAGKVHEGTMLTIFPVSDENYGPFTKNDFEKLCLKETEIGEIVVRGLHVLESYFNNQRADERHKIMVDTTVWHRTGDSGFFKDGTLYLTGRCAQLIFKEDKFIAPLIIEHQLKQVAGITNGTILNHEGRLLLIVKSSLKPVVLKSRLEHIKYDALVVLKQLPMDPRHHGKIDYKVLLNRSKKVKKNG